MATEFCPFCVGKRQRRYMLYAPFGVLLALGFFSAVNLQGIEQTPPGSNPNLSIPNIMLLHTKDWPTGTPASVPQPYLTRTNAGERWFNIEQARGKFCINATTCESGPNYTYTYLGNLITASGSNPSWVSAARSNSGAPYPSALMYTFSTVPAWASGVGSDPTASTPNPPTDLSADRNNRPPEACQNVLTGYTSQKGDCMFKEYVTYVMRALCHTPTQPSSPLIGACEIHYFEGWNEFNSDSFWTGNYDQLGQMMADADEIVHRYCGDCYFMAGSVSAGGDGYHTNGETGVYANALGELLDDWKYYDSLRPPDIISFHAYPSRDNIFPVPMPETNVSASGYSSIVPTGFVSGPSQMGCGAPNPAPVYPEAGKGYSCRDSVVNMVPELKLVIQHEGTWLPSSVQIWNTESGWGQNGGLDFDSLTNTYDPAVDRSLTDTQRQGYMARASILLASSGAKLNLWYQLDNSGWGTLATYDANGDPSSAVNTPAANTFDRVYDWLQGVTFTSPCTSSNDVWTCPLTKANGSKGMIAWYDVTDKYATFNMPGGLTYIHDMDGNTLSRSPGQTLRLFNRPALLDTNSGSE